MLSQIPLSHSSSQSSQDGLEGDHGGTLTLEAGSLGEEVRLMWGLHTMGQKKLPVDEHGRGIRAEGMNARPFRGEMTGYHWRTPRDICSKFPG